MRDPGRPAERTSEIIRALTTAGWLAFAAWALFLFRQIGRALQVSEQAFAGIGEQRIEVLSFLVLPPNSLVIVPAAIAAATATWIAGPTQTIDLAIQLRLVRWAAVLQIGIASVSAVSIVVNETGSPTETQDIAMRLSGILSGLAVVVVTRAAERSSPGGSTAPAPMDALDD